ncbi:hypothetical protein IE4872_PC00142 (plasmid) [Rhizobium gallicum]|uniref:Uncharacterized protein n=1 Tax=Rhizobium gallicum TaxID=56730 RepID=A0A1L5NQJ2_9HYPH|nr:hypothetical protein IE4872_PC00142 [Rhizobium gallicum]
MNRCSPWAAVECVVPIQPERHLWDIDGKQAMATLAVSARSKPVGAGGGCVTLGAFASA